MSRIQRMMNGMRSRGSCGKVKYQSHGAANRARIRMIENGSGDPCNDDLLGQYWCDDCDAYHVGHNWGERRTLADSMSASAVWASRVSRLETA